VTPADDAEALALAEEAEAAEAEAVAAAARARARAIRLRRQARLPESGAPDVSDAESEATNAEAQGSDAEAQGSDAEAQGSDAEPTVAEEAEAEPARGRRLRLWRRKVHEADPVATATEAAALRPASKRRWLPGWNGLVTSLGVVCTIGLLGASGWMIWNHRQEDALHQREVEFAAAARQGVVTLMSLDFNHAKEDVQRVIDNATGRFKQDFQDSSDDFTKAAQDAKVITEVTVNDTAVESMSGDSAVVLVSATSRVTTAAGAKQEPRSWRLGVTMQRDGDRIKMSKVEFVP
jgi:Mce-associated membrane protein